MNKDPHLPTSAINKRLMLTLHQDGLLDVLAGLIVLTFGLIPILDNTNLTPGLRQLIILLFYGLSVTSVIWFKQMITLPRTGLVQLSKKTTSRMSIVLLVVNVLIFLIFAGVYIFDLAIWEFFGSYQLSIPLGLIFLVMLSVSGGLLKAIRFYLYGVLVFVSFVLFEHLYLKGLVVHHGIPWASFISGGLIILSGIFILYRFVNRYKVD